MIYHTTINVQQKTTKESDRTREKKWEKKMMIGISRSANNFSTITSRFENKWNVKWSKIYIEVIFPCTFVHLHIYESGIRLCFQYEFNLKLTEEKLIF